MNHRRKAVIFITTCIIITSLINVLIKEAWTIQVQASSFFLDSNRKKVVVIMVDSIELQDFAKNDYLSYLFNNSYSSLISGRQSSKSTIAKAKLAIGAGKRLELNNGLRNTTNYNDNIELLDNQIIVGEKGNVIYRDIKYLKKQNEGNGYDSYVGYLGSKLKQYHKTTCLIGNSDTDIMNRSSVLIAMDKNGIVDIGDVENTTKPDSHFPGGKKTDFGKLTSLYKQYIGISDFTVIDTGDLIRLDYYKNQISKEEFAIHKAETIYNIAEFTRNIIANTNQKTTFILLSSYPSKSNLQSGLKISPILIFDNDGQGHIYSQSTRRTGIITNLDIADYILDKLIDTETANLKLVPSAEPFETMLSLTIKLLNISKLRLPVLTWYAIFEIICAMAGLLYMFNLNNQSNKLINLVKITMLVNIVAPVVLLYMSIFEISSKSIYFGLFILISFIVAALLFLLIKTIIGQFLGAALLVNISIIIDLLRGSTFIKNSVFGYDPIIGARFYGIGNEFAGVFIGSGILLAGCLLQYFRNFTEKKSKITTMLLIIYCGFQLFIMGMPFIGSNFGGTIAGVVAYFFFFCSIRQKKI
ncbi:MAG: hypothetical protein K0S75_2344, partial [Clostridia bacterium]|nr:hypothetical protein [Clostridia bacterium]